MILGLHHAAIAVTNMQRALDFYVDVVGFDVVEEHTLLSWQLARCRRQ